MVMIRNTAMDTRELKKENDETRKEHYQGSGGGEWSARLKFTTRPLKLHFVAPEELYVDPYNPKLLLPYRRLIRHFFKFGNKMVYIECGGDNCVPEAYITPAKFGLNIEPDKALKHLCKTEFPFAISGIVDELYHLVEQTSEAGKKYLERVLCDGKGCENCRIQGPKNRVYGKRVYTIFSNGAWFYGLQPHIDKMARKCKCGGEIYVTEYVCAKCGAQLIDVANTCEYCTSQGVAQSEIEVEPSTQTATCKTCGCSWSLIPTDDKSLDKAVNTEYKCSCGHQGFAEPKLICTDCEKPDPYGLFDIQFTICKESEEKQAKTIVTDVKPLVIDQRLYDPQFQGAFQGASAEQAEAAQHAAERMKKAIDLDRIFVIESTGQQAQKIGKPDPFAGTEQAINTGGAQYAATAEEATEQYRQ